MKFILKNLAPVQKAEIELAPLTIICGKNNTGKTRITNTIYEFYQLFRKTINIPVKLEKVEFPFQIDLKDYKIQAIKAIEESATSFSSEYLHDEGSFSVKICTADILSAIKCKAPESSYVFENLKVKVSKKGTKLTFSRIEDANESTSDNVSLKVVSDIVSLAIRNYLFKQEYNNSFIGDSFSVMTERTGLVYFKKQINIANATVANRFLESVTECPKPSTLSKRDVVPLSGFNIDLSVFKALTCFEMWNDSDFRTQTRKTDEYRQQFIEDLNNLVEGKYEMERGSFFFSPNEKESIKLPINTTSSSVKALLLLDYYIRYMAEKGDLLIIDEPELNLHPEKQRQLSHFLAKLVNAGIKVFLTTHSDYIIREFNTLLMLNQDKQHLRDIQKREGYADSELLKATDVKAYVSRKKTNGFVDFDEAPISQDEGISISTLDEVIDKMNTIQEEITWGE